MEEELRKTNIKIRNYWVVYFAVSTVLYFFSSWHWPIKIFSIINYNLYFLVFLLSIAIFRKAQYNRYIFLNLSLFSLFYVLSFFHTFVGDHYLIGDNYLMYYILPYRKLAISVITCITVVYISIEYLFYREKTLNKYLMTLAIVLPINFGFFSNFLLDKNYIFNDKRYLELFSCTIETNLLALFFIGLYGYLLYKKEKPIGEYINTIMLGLFFFVIYDLVDGFSYYYYSNIPLPGVSYLILTIFLIYFIIVLFKKIRYLHSEFGKFYEGFKFSDRKIDLRLLKKKTFIAVIIKSIRNYLNIFPNRLFFILLMIISVALFLFFFPKGYGKQIIFALSLSLGVVLYYWNILLKKRDQ